MLAVNKNHTPVESTPMLYTCAEHAHDLRFDEVVNDNAFEILCRLLESNGRERPIRKFCSLKIVHIDENKKPKDKDNNRLQ